jgi:nucleoside-diphosphate-sugar epimerase
MNAMRLLITGGAGCLGSNLVEKFFLQGHPICVIDNFATSKREVLPAQPGLMVVEGSVANADLVNRTFADFQPTHVIHSAAAYKDPQNWVEDAATNVLGAIHVAKAAQQNKVTRFINFQTALCYGRPVVMPITADQPTAPFTSYGISKTAGEAYLMESSLAVVSLRLANICGPRLAIGPIPTFYKRIKAGQNCFCSDAIRDFMDMSDFLSLMEQVLQPDAPTGVYNVSTGKGSSIRDVYLAVSNYLGIAPSDISVVPTGLDDVPSVILDPTATEKAFGWCAQVGFEETIANQLRWYDQYGVTDVFSHLTSPVP